MIAMPQKGKFMGSALKAQELAVAIEKGEDPPNPKHYGSIGDMTVSYSELILLKALRKIDKALDNSNLTTKDMAQLAQAARDHYVEIKRIRIAEKRANKGPGRPKTKKETPENDERDDLSPEDMEKFEESVGLSEGKKNGD